METNGCKKRPEQVRCIELPCESLYFGFVVFFSAFRCSQYTAVFEDNTFEAKAKGVRGQRFLSSTTVLSEPILVTMHCILIEFFSCY